MNHTQGGKQNENDMRQMTSLGHQIENNSFAIIDKEAGEHTFTADQWEVVRRVIHATADFEFKNIIRFTDNAVEAGVKTLVGGGNIIVDVKMISAGLNQSRLNFYGCKVHSFISDEDVIAEAKEKGSTRAIGAMQKAKNLNLLEDAVVAIGNAPTALIELARMIREEGVKPALIIGVPVGFVSAIESKKKIMPLDIPSIISQGRKGGTTIAVAVIHALLLLSKKEAS